MSGYNTNVKILIRLNYICIALFVILFFIVIDSNRKFITYERKQIINLSNRLVSQAETMKKENSENIEYNQKSIKIISNELNRIMPSCLKGRQ